jgi:excisionase family DNA binding protein
MSEVVTSTIRSFSKRTGLSRSYIYVLLQKGDLESSKIGGVRLIHEDSYLRLLARNRVPPKHTAAAA